MVRLAAEKRMELWKKFELLDKSGDGKLDFKEMKALLVKSNPSLQDEALRVLFKRIDTNNDGSVDFDEFVDYLYKSPPVYHKAPELCVQKFREFAGKDMDGSEFRNFCLLCNLVDKKFTRGDVDTLFAKVVPRGKRRITLEVGADGFSQYDKLLSLLAEKKRVPVETIFELVGEGVRMISGTIPESNQLHDDQSKWTHTRTEARREAEAMRQEGTGSQGVGSVEITASRSPRGAKGEKSTRSRQGFHSNEGGRNSQSDEGDWEDCQTIFDAYNREGEGLLSFEFVKLCEDVGIADGAFTEDRTVTTLYTELQTDMLDFEGFKDALRLIAAWRQEPTSEIQAAVASCVGP